MEWTFLAFTLLCLAYLVYIVRAYSAQASEWNAKVRQAQAEVDASDAQVQAFVKGKEEALARTHTIEAELQTIENLKNELKNRIEEVKREHSKKGKVVLHRQGSQEG